MLKSYEFGFEGQLLNFYPVIREYKSNNSLAIELYLLSDLGYELFDVISVNLDGFVRLESDLCFIDVNNSFHVSEFINKHQLGQEVGVDFHQGFCKYPLYKFDLNKLNTFEDFDSYFMNKFLKLVRHN